MTFPCVVFAFLALATMAGTAFAAPTIALSVKIGHPTIATQVSGSGFTANEAVDVYFDTTDEFLTTADSTGAFPNHELDVPKDALPGSHWITAVGRQTGDSAQQLFAVRTDWKKYQFDAANHGKNPYENVIEKSNVGTLALAWSYAVVDYRGALVGSPIVYKNLIYLGTERPSSSLYALTTEGTVEWQIESARNGDSYFKTTPTYEGGTLYVNGSGIRGFDPATGVPKWGVRSPGEEYSPVVAGNILYINSIDRVFAFSTATGTTQPLWIVDITESGQECANSKRPAFSWPLRTIGTPAVVNGIVYVGYSDGVCALNAATGAVLWTGTNGGSEPAVANGAVYSASGDGKLYALNASTGDVLWTFGSGNVATTVPSVANGKVFVGLGQRIYALDESSGALEWNAPIDGTGPPTSVSIANGVGYLASGKTVYALDIKTGARLWTAQPGIISGAPTVVNGFVYVNSTNSNFYAYALNGGKNSAYKPRQPPSYASLHPDHRLKVSH
jgi:outer membrane protein assembly factor BamB